MTTTLLRAVPSAALALFAALVPTSVLAAQSDDIDVRRVGQALQMWLANWQRGQYDIAVPPAFRGKLNQKNDFPSVKLGLQHESVLKGIRYTQRTELEWLVGQLVEVDNAEVAEMLLQVAAVGLDGRKRDLEQGAAVVRGIGAEGLAKMKSAGARSYVMSVASGDERAKDEEQCAALRVVGQWGSDGVGEVLAKAVEDKDETIRLAAVVGAGLSKNDAALIPLAGLIVEEDEQPVLLKAIESATLILAEKGKEVDQTGLRRVATAVVGRIDDEMEWRVGLAAVKFLELARLREAVPALVELLARYGEDPKAVERGELSGTLKWEANRVLRSLTGATFPIDKPLAWRAWWKTAEANFKLAELKEEDAEVKTKARSFFGIPVRGNRVLFIVDNSGSMQWPTAQAGDDGKRRSGLDLAKRELEGVIAQLDENDSFNVVRFSNGPSAWQKRLVPANEKNKERFVKFVEDLRADGGTNLWGGIKEGLGLRSMAHGDRFASEVDEVFILSDGAPSQGDIIDPRQIANVLGEINTFSKLVINTIFIDVVPPGARPAGQSPFDMDGAELMKTIAHENGGTYRRVRG